MMLFLNQPEEAFFIRELTRRINTQINAVRREIENLSRFGLITEMEEVDSGQAKRPGLKRKYYKINPSFPLLLEIKSLMIKSHLLMEKTLHREIASIGNVEYLAFMGAFLGQKDPVDLFIVGTLDADKMQQLMNKAERDMNAQINFTCLSPQEFAYRREITDRFLISVLNGNKCVAIDKLNLEKEKKETLL